MRNCLRWAQAGTGRVVVLVFATGCAAADPQKSAPGSFCFPASVPQLPWCVTGRTVDEHDRPLAGVEVLAQCGAGTLRVTGRTVSDADGRGRPRPKTKLWLSGDALPPSSSVVVSAETDAAGRFTMADIPPRRWWFIVDAGDRREVRSETYSFEKSGRYAVELICNGPAAPLALRVISHP